MLLPSALLATPAIMPPCMLPNPDEDDAGDPKPADAFVPGAVRLLNGLPWLVAVAPGLVAVAPGLVAVAPGLVAEAPAFCPSPICIPGPFWPFGYVLELVGAGGFRDGSAVEVAMVFAPATKLPEFPFALPFAAIAAAR